MKKTKIMAGIVLGVGFLALGYQTLSVFDGTAGQAAGALSTLIGSSMVVAAIAATGKTAPLGGAR